MNPELAVIGTPHSAVWKALIHKVVYLVARTFDFQTFNQAAGEPVTWVPASAAVAADHLCQLIIYDGLPREIGDEPVVESDGRTSMRLPFARAVWRLHATIFLPFQKWAEHVRVDPFPPEHEKMLSGLMNEFAMTRLGLLDLALYFAVWTEAANVKHMPEGMWFLYWALRHSRDFDTLVKSAIALEWIIDPWTPGWGYLTDVADRRVVLRNTYAGLIEKLRGRADAEKLQDELSKLIRQDTMFPWVRNSAMLQTVLVENRSKEAGGVRKVLDAVVAEARRFLPDARPALNDIDHEILLDLVVYGDGGEFSRRIIAPIFQYLAFEVDLKGGAGKEPVLRITYDDANESFVDHANFTSIRTALGVTMSGKKSDTHKAFTALWLLGGASEGEWDEKKAREWYHDRVFVKTYRERRTWFAPYRAFFRVIAFHVVLFHLMLAVAFVLDRPKSERKWTTPVTSVTITHTFLEMFDAYGGAYIQWTVASPPAANKKLPYKVVHNTWGAWLCCCLPCLWKKTRDGTDYEKLRDRWNSPNEWRVRSLLGLTSKLKSLMGFFFWLALWVLVTAVFVLQIVLKDDAILVTGTKENNPKYLKEVLDSVWNYVGWVYPAVVGIHWLVTTRDGYVAGVHTVAATSASVWTKCLRAFSCYGSCWSSAVTASNSFLYTNPSTGWLQLFLNVLFWAFVLAIKVTFDYLVVVKQLVKPIKALLNFGYLSSGSGDFPQTAIPYPDADWILIAALCLPALLIVIVDTGVWYQVGVFAYGCTNGLLRLNLGQITDWSDVIREYSSGVANFHLKLMSGDAKNTWKSLKNINTYYNQVMDSGQEASITVGGGESQRLTADNEIVTAEGAMQVREVAQWTTFSDCWEHIVADMRDNDLVSNAEQGDLVFKKLPLLKKYGLKPLVLPCIFYAGKVQAIMDRAAVPSRGNATVLKEMFILFLVLLKELGIIPSDNTVDFEKLRAIYLHPSTTTKYHAQCRGFMVDAVRDLITKIHNFCTTAKALRQNKAYVAAAPTDDVRVRADKARVDAVKAIAQDVTRLVDFAEIELNILKESGGDRKNVQAKINAVKAIRKVLQAEGQEALLATTTAAKAKTVPAVPSAAMMNKFKAVHAAAAEPGSREQQTAAIAEVLRNAMTQTEQQAQPNNKEACRVIRFFMASLFNPQLRSPAPIERVMSLTNLVPHYAEDVIYALDADAVQRAVGVRPRAGEMTDLTTATEYDITTMEYLRVQNGNEWDNFVERVLSAYYATPDAVKYEDPKGVVEADFRTGGRLQDYADDLMLWASQRGQLLARTTRGMLLYEKALRVLATLESPDRAFSDKHEVDLQELLEAKFRHIVASQVYGEKKASGKAADKWLANSVDQLMRMYPSFRVAYVDSKTVGNNKRQASVLLRNAHDKATGADSIVEIYRVRLPWQDETKRGIVLGEGKPENQNHAAIFCFGEALQTVDMNQDNCLAEALKMRNLLHEFGTDDKQVIPALNARDAVNVISFRGKLVAQIRKRDTALVGFREYIFSNTAGSVGSFAAGAEFAFGTIVQRTMANPGGVRFHYGHPDVWNKLFTMTRGGVSKATRGFHISEDVFGGYNTVQRGARIKYREYISVGKGRDVGFEQINGFEAKVAGGNGEQAISRDVYRLGTRLDWFRLMSWYHSGIGFFINTTLLMASIYVSVWVLFLFGLATNRLKIPVQSGADVVDKDVANPVPAFTSAQVLQLGFLSILPYFGELLLEEGLVSGTFNILRQMVAGSVPFFIFRQQTSAHFFVQDVYYGGASYVATGRGFALKHTPYVSMFSNFGRSHMYFGFQLGLMAFVVAFLDIPDYSLSTWGTWLVSASLFFGPFWFNPLSFKTAKVHDDYVAWRDWMKDNRDPGTKKSWYTWHTEQLAKARNVAGLQTDHTWNRVAGIAMQAFNVVIVMACFENLDDKYTTLDENGNRKTVTSRITKVLGIGLFELMVCLIPAWALIRSLFAGKLHKTAERAIIVSFTAVFVGLLVCYLTIFGNTIADGFKDVVLLLFANFSILVILAQFLLYLLPNQQWAQSLVDSAYYVGDTCIGLILFGVLFVLSLVPLIDSLQTTLLFNFEFRAESEASAVKNMISKLAKKQDETAEAQAKRQTAGHSVLKVE